MNSNLDRWIFASATQHFYTNRGTTPMYIEGQHRPDPDATLYEVRINGPHSAEISSNYYRHDIEVNILVQVMRSTDLHKLHKLTGAIKAAFTPITVYKYGDDNSVVGCFQLITRQGQRVETRHLGQVFPDKDILYATVEGRYVMFLEDTS